MSLRNLIKRYLPHKDHFHKQSGIQVFSDYLHDPNIWHVHKRSSAGGAAIGVFCAFIPFPVQMLSSAALAIIFRMNLPIAVLSSFVSNPITIPPLFFFTYRLGVNILGIKEKNVDFSFSWDWFGNTLIHIWEPLLLGCFIMGTISSVLTYLLVRLIWRFSAIAKWEKRRKTK
ncbi:MAG: DUF2062 domain-containing protein [Proteobacteria bacterium]|nr:DUF2062 domain-containing protein [Pseudomonadota bacterium]NOG59463.1 DUF2062 domain-containing protein [Pseudomonadota bacterium]